LSIFARANFTPCDFALTEPQSGLLTTTIPATVFLTELTALGGVDPVQPDVLTTDLERVAIDDAGDANDRRLRGLGSNGPSRHQQRANVN